jgi:hypothetical protein
MVSPSKQVWGSLHFAKAARRRSKPSGSQVKSSQVKLIVAECQNNGMYAIKVRANKKMTTPLLDSCSQLAGFHLRPAADRTDPIFSWAVNDVDHNAFSWLILLFINLRKDDQTPSCCPVSGRSAPTALVEVHWAAKSTRHLRPKLVNPISSRTSLSKQ